MNKITIIIAFFFTLIANAQTVSIPDANFKAKLLSASSSNTIASTEAQVYNATTGTWSVISTYSNIDTSGDGEIQVSEALVIKYLDLSASNISNLSGIESFTNLQNLICSDNQLSFLDVSQNTVLTYLNCGINPFTSLNLSQNTNLNILRIYYNQLNSLNLSQNTALIELACAAGLINSLDISQCTLLKYLYCGNNQISILNISPNSDLEYLDCSGNQITILNTSQNSALQVLNCIGNQITSLDVSQNSALRYLLCTGNQLSNLDVSQNTALLRLKCGNNQITSLDISTCKNLNDFNCSNNNLVFLNIKNGLNFEVTGVYNSLVLNATIGNNPNLTYLCHGDITGSYSQYFSLLNSINSFVVANTYCSFVPNGNYNTITGTATYDNENDGCDSNDANFEFLRLGINGATPNGSTFTNATGNYNFYTQIGNFTVTPQLENPTYFTVAPTSAVLNFANNNNNTTTQNFCITPNGVHTDVEVVFAPIDAARPGFDATYLVVYKNKGNQTVSGTIATTFNDDILDFVSATNVPTSVSTGQLTWDYTNLAPFENRTFYVTFNVNSPTETPAVNIGDILVFSTQITPLVDDIPSDNTFVFNQTVVGSFDPNEISCLEGTTANASQIGDYLHYIVLFENTGTFQADNVVVKLQINPAQFDINSLQELSASHPVYTRISNNTVEFIFENCQLASGPPAGGHGHVPFKIKTRQNLLPNDAVLNKANIYFDYNAPIITNDAATTFALLNQNVFNEDNSVLISPNPTNSKINIDTKTTIKTIELYDIQGRLLQTQLLNSNTTTLDISDKANGIYFVKVKTANGQKVVKIVKE